MKGCGVTRGHEDFRMRGLYKITRSRGVVRGSQDIMREVILGNVGSRDVMKGCGRSLRFYKKKNKGVTQCSERSCKVTRPVRIVRGHKGS